MTDFFVKLKKSVDRWTAVIGVKSNELLEAAKVKNKIGTLKGQKRNQIEELGNLVYSMSNEGTFGEEKIKAKCTEIQTIENEIKEKEKEPENIHLKARKALEEKIVVSICNCGTKLYEGERFCGKCGQKVPSENPK